MAGKNQKYPWQWKICNADQIGGVETSILDDGLGKGGRTAWVNTGSGLRYKVVAAVVFLAPMKSRDVRIKEVNSAFFLYIICHTLFAKTVGSYRGGTLPGRR